MPVEYFSHHLLAAEQNYCATEHEFVTIIQGLHHWKHYLIGHDVMVKTDYASL